MFDHSHSTATAAPRKRPRQQRSRALVDRVLDAAARIFTEDGYRATTTNDVAAAAGVSIGSMYQYFPNKDALLVGLAERHLGEALPLLVEAGARLRIARPDPEDTCRAFVDAAAGANAGPLHRLLWTAPRTPELAEALGAAEQAMAEEVAWHLRRFGHAEGDAGRRARLLVAAVEAAVHHPAMDDDREAWIGEVIRLCLSYVADPGPGA